MEQSRRYDPRRFNLNGKASHLFTESQVESGVQGGTKGAPRQRAEGEVLTVTVNPPASITREEKLDARILSILGQPSYSAYLGWSWTNLRQRIGGKVRTVEFQEAVKRLLAAGEIVECWMQSNGPEPTHRVMLARVSQFIDPATLISIRGRRDFVAQYQRSPDGLDE